MALISLDWRGVMPPPLDYEYQKTNVQMVDNSSYQSLPDVAMRSKEFDNEALRLADTACIQGSSVQNLSSVMQISQRPISDLFNIPPPNYVPSSDYAMTMNFNTEAIRQFGTNLHIREPLSQNVASLEQGYKGAPVDLHTVPPHSYISGIKSLEDSKEGYEPIMQPLEDQQYLGASLQGVVMLHQNFQDSPGLYSDLPSNYMSPIEQSAIANTHLPEARNDGLIVADSGKCLVNV